MTIKIAGVSVVNVTPQVASQLLRDNKYPKQRALNPGRMGQYERDKKDGEFVIGTTIKFACYDGDTYLIDGQHRLESIAATGVPDEMVRIDMTVDTEDELAKLYYTTDMGLPRSIGQMFRSMELGDRMGVPDYLAQRAGNAINFIRAGWMEKKSAGLTRNEILRALVNEYATPLTHYREAAQAKTGGFSNSMWRSSVSSLGLETFRYATDPEKFRRTLDFWTAVVKGENMQMGDPRMIAREHIMTTTMSAKKEVVTVARSYQVRYLALCWNAWYEDRLLNAASRTGAVRVRDQYAPILIAGTPWDGTKVSIY